MELYIHIPFCIRKCEYCSFVSFPATETEKNTYISSLLREAEIRQDEIISPLSSIYIGGGTPSLLSVEQFSRLSEGIRLLFPILPDAEFSIEANPGTLTAGFLSAAASAGVNRLSIGMQAFQPDLLRFLGRIHTFAQVEQSVKLARSSGLNNLNLDLIFGIPGQTFKEWENSLDAALSLAPDHISAYGLIPEEGTSLWYKLVNHQITLPEPDEEREMYDLAIRKLHEAGLEQYEISNFARKGYECRHNIGYWTQIPYVGLGISAASMLITSSGEGGLRYLRKTNPSDPAVYMDIIRNGMSSPGITEERIGIMESRFETLMLGLRMNQGVSDNRFKTLHGVPIESCFGEKLRFMQKKGLMRHENKAWVLTRRGMDIQNSILVELMDNLS